MLPLFEARKTTMTEKNNNSLRSSVELIENLTNFCEQRARVYVLLSRCFEKEIDAEFASALSCEVTFDSSDEVLSQQFKELQNSLCAEDADQIEKLAVIFNRIFFGMGPMTAQKAFPYESVYTSAHGLMMQDAYVQTKKFYEESQFVRNPDFTEPDDHIAVQLAFMAQLCQIAGDCLKQGKLEKAEQEFAKQLTFLQEHLLNWTNRFFIEVKEASGEDFYVQLAVFSDAFLKADAQELTEIID